MKYTAALAGLVSAVRMEHSDTWKLRSVLDHRTDSEVQEGFLANAISTAEEEAQAKAEKVGYDGGAYDGNLVQTGTNVADVWSLRSVNDHKTDSDLQIDFGSGATKTANKGASDKAEKSGYEGGDYAFMQTEEGGIYVQTEAKDDTTKVWDLRSVNWHADESSDFQQSGHYHTAAGNADAQAKAESQSYHPVTWGNVFA